MKNLFFILIILFSCKSFAQNPILSDSIKKAGIYRTFQEFKNNNPSLILDFKIDKQDRTLGMYDKNSKTYPAYGIDIDERVSENVGVIYGFCDGKDIYLTRNMPIFMHYIDFFKVEILDRYCIFDYTSVNLSGGSGNGLFNKVLNNYTRILNLDSGQSHDLTKKWVRKIIQDNMTLSKEFEADKDKMISLKEYIIQYLKK